jgi:hypothetical protein
MRAGSGSFGLVSFFGRSDDGQDQLLRRNPYIRYSARGQQNQNGGLHQKKVDIDIICIDIHRHLSLDNHQLFGEKFILTFNNLPTLPPSYLIISKVNSF